MFKKKKTIQVTINRDAQHRSHSLSTAGMLTIRVDVKLDTTAREGKGAEGRRERKREREGKKKKNSQALSASAIA